MPIKDLSQSLINSVVEVFTQSSENHNKLVQKVVAEGLKHFGVNSVSDLSESDQKAFRAWTQLRLSESDCHCGEVEEDDMPGDEVFHKDGDESGEKKDLGEEDSEDELKDLEKLKITENIALAADEIATNGAVAVGDALVATPKHADVIHDTDPYTGVTQYRLLLQYTTNEGTRIYPPVSLPGAVSVADLRTLVQGLPEFNEAVDAALVHASSTVDA